VGDKLSQKVDVFIEPVGGLTLGPGGGPKAQQINGEELVLVGQMGLHTAPDDV